MQVNFINVPTKFQPSIKDAVSVFLDKNLKKRQILVNVEFASRAKSCKLNKKYRKIDAPTDVLSFPIWNKINEIPQTGQVLLGDIIICPEETDLDKNLKNLVQHSLRHLIGIHH